MNRKMTRFAFAAKCDFFAESGPRPFSERARSMLDGVSAVARRPSSARRPAKAMLPKPAPACRRKSRRSCMRIVPQSVQVDKFIQIEQRPAQFFQRGFLGE